MDFCWPGFHGALKERGTVLSHGSHRRSVFTGRTVDAARRPAWSCPATLPQQSLTFSIDSLEGLSGAVISVSGYSLLCLMLFGLVSGIMFALCTGRNIGLSEFF
jgi:hypothetical protein